MVKAECDIEVGRSCTDEECVVAEEIEVEGEGDMGVRCCWRPVMFGIVDRVDGDVSEVEHGKEVGRDTVADPDRSAVDLIDSEE